MNESHLNDIRQIIDDKSRFFTIVLAHFDKIRKEEAAMTAEWQIKSKNQIADDMSAYEEIKKIKVAQDKKYESWSYEDYVQERAMETNVYYNPLTIGEDDVDEFTTLEQALYNVFIIQVFTHIEYALLELCKALAARQGQRIPVELTRGNGITRSLAYIRSITRDHFFPTDFRLGDELRVLSAIRNKYMHENSEVSNKNIFRDENEQRTTDKNADVLQRYSKSYALIALSEDKIIINRKYLDRIMAVNKAICSEISTYQFP